ncbi:uncharacterized protein LOC120144681 [Hibiscus syriacus]|uniref:uncharacterized protein LOC120144681 n=1 Tax=Hibiscus syriacus TaxID=106335 RepID=UPI0019231FB3|nr:uncharacterized protein LOC120144681 [Hibiscus syriacus]
MQPDTNLLFPGTLTISADHQEVLTPVADSDHAVGCGHPRFIPAAKQFLRDYKPDLVLFIKAPVSGRRVYSVIASLGFPNSHHIEAVGFSGGIWITWYASISVEVILNHYQFVHCRITSKLSKNIIYATVVYASLSASGRKLLWPHLRHIDASIRSPWILFGDFNATVFDLARKGCAASTTSSRAFQNLIFDHGLRDMGYQDPDFTWTRGFAHARLDRFICNSYWDENYLDSEVQHLLRFRSDHADSLTSGTLSEKEFF